MPRHLPFLAICLLAAGASLYAADAAEAATTPSAQAQAARYHEALRRRPAAGALFDRFFDAWLAAGTVAELRESLQTAAATSTADRLILALFLARTGDDLGAVRELRAVIAAGAAAPETHLLLAEASARLLDFAGAISALEGGLDAATGPLADRMRTLHGRLLVRSGQRAAGLAVWTALADSRPGDDDLQDDVVQTLLQEGLLGEAAERCHRIIASTSDPYRRAMTSLRLGEILDRDGKTSDALTTWRTLLTQVGNDSWLEKEVLAEIERVHRREEDLTGLITVLRELAASEPQRSALRRRLAQVLLAQEQTDEALNVFRGVLEQHPGDTTLRREYADLLARADRPGEAAAQLDLLLAAAPGDSELLTRVAELHHAAGDGNAAAAAIARLVAADPGIAAGLRAARALETFGQVDAADALYTDLRARHAEDADLALAHAAFLHQQQRSEEALAIATQVAARGDAEVLLRVVRDLRARAQDAHAYHLVGTALTTQRNHPQLLEAHAQLALALDEPAQALASARQRLYLSSSGGELAQVIGLILNAAERTAALTTLRQELEALPEPGVHDRCLLAELRERDGDPAGAIAILGTADEPLVQAMHLRLLTARQDWTAAAELLERWADQPGERRLHHIQELVALHRRRGDDAAALRWLAAWKQIAPAAHQPWLLEASVHTDRLRQEAALGVLRQAALRFPQEREVLARLAQIYADTGGTDDASRIYWQLYEQTDDLAQQLAWVRQLATLAEQSGRTEALLARFAERRTGNRQAIAPLLAMADVHAVSGNTSGRRDALLEAVRLRPEDVNLLIEIARLESESGDWEAAVATLRRAETIQATPVVRQRLAELYLANGFEEDGLRLLRNLAGESSDPRHRETLALQLAHAERWGDVHDLMEAAITEHPADLRLQYLRALALLEAGRSEAATVAFIDLLAWDQELPAAATGTPASATPLKTLDTWLAQMGQVVPELSVELMRQTWAVAAAQAHRQGQHPSHMMGGMGHRTLHLPDDVASLHRMVVAQLGHLLTDADDDRRQALTTAIERAGIAHAALLLSVPGIESFSDWVATLDPAVHGQDLALRALQMVAQAQNDLAVDVDAEVMANLFVDHPLLAFLAAARTHDDARAAAALQRVLADGLPSDYALQLVLSALDLFGSMGDAVPDDDRLVTTRATLRTALRTHFPAYARATFTQTSGYGAWMLDSIIPFLIADAEIDEVLALVNAVIADHEAQPSVSGSAQMQQFRQYGMMQRQQDATFPHPLPVPPDTVETLPDTLMLMVPHLDSEALLPHLERIPNPLFAAIIAVHAEDYAQADRLIAPLLTGERPALDAVLLGAALAARAEDHVRALDLLHRASLLPMRRERRQQVDIAVVHAVVALTARDEAQLAQGRAAALRLRHAGLGTDRRFALADALATLGLKIEAKALEEESSRLIASTPASAAHSGDIPQQIRDLVSKDRSDAAVLLALRQLQAQAAQDLTPNAMMHGMASYWEMRQLREALTTHRLLDAVAERSAQDATANQRKRLEHARVLVHLDRGAQAVDLHRELVGERPRDQRLRQLYGLLLLRHEPATALAELRAATADQRHELITVWLAEIGITHGDIDSLLGLAQVVVEYAEQDGLPLDHDLPAIADLLERLGGAISIADNRSDLSDRFSEEGLNDTKDELNRRRGDLHDRLCRSLLQHPTLASEAFARLYHLAERARDADTIATLTAQAGDILRREHTLAPTPGNAQTQMMRQMMINMSRHQEPQIPLRFRGPDEVLVRSAFTAGTLPELSAGLAAELAATPDSLPTAQRLNALIELYTAEDAAFAAACEAIIAGKPGSDAPAANRLAADRSGVVVQCLSDRQLSFDLGPLALAEAERAVARLGNRFTGQSPTLTLAPLWLDHLARRKDRSGSTAFLASLRDRVLGSGPAGEKRLQRLRAMAAANSWHHNEDYLRAELLATTLTTASQHHHALLIPTIVAAQFAPHSSAWMIAQRIETLLRTGDGPTVWEMLDGCSLLNEVNAFADVEQQGFQDGSLLRSVLQRLSSNPTARDHVVAALRASAEPPPFGASLLAGLLAQDHPAVYATFGRALSELQAWDDAARDRLMTTLAPVLPPDEAETADAAATDAMVAAGRQWLAAQRAGTEDRRFAALLALTEWDDDLMGMSTIGTQLIPLLRPRLAEHRDQVDAVIAHVVLLATRAQARGQRSWHFREGDTWPSRIYVHLVDRQDDPLALAYVCQRVRAAQAPVAPLAVTLRTALVSALRARLDRLPATALLTHFDTLQAELAQHGFVGDWYGLLPVLREWCARLELSAVRTVANGLAAAAPGSATWCAAAAAHLDLHRRGESVAVPPVITTTLTTALANEADTALGWRMAALAVIPSGAADAALAAVSAAVLAETVAARQPIPPDLGAALVHQLAAVATPEAEVGHADLLRSLIAQRQTPVAHGRHSQRLGSEQSLVPYDAALVALAYATGAPDLARRVILQQPALAQERATWISMLRAGDASGAAEAIRLHLSSPGRRIASEAVFDERAEQALAGVAASIADPGLRAVASGLLVTLPGPDPARRRERIRAFARTLTAEQVQDPAVANAVLIGLTEAAGDVVLPFTQAAVAQLDLTDLFSESAKRSSDDPRLWLLSGHLMACLQSGDPGGTALVEAVLAAAKAGRAAGAGNAWTMAGGILSTLERWSNETPWEGRTPAQLVVARDLIRQILPHSGPLRPLQAQYLYTDHVLFTVLTAGLDDLAAWQAAFATAHRKLDTRFKTHGVAWPRLRAILGQAVRAAEPVQRRAWVAAVLRLDEVHVHARAEPHLLQQLVDDGLTTWEELDAVAVDAVGSYARESWRQRQTAIAPTATP